MRTKVILLVTITLLILVSCGTSNNFEKKKVDGIIQYINSEKPSDTNATLKLRKLHTISSKDQTDSIAFFKSAVDFSVDKNENLYILDIVSRTVKKFDKNGLFVKSIGKAGIGQGELSKPILMFIDNDTLKVLSMGVWKLSKYDLDGNFYEDKKIEPIDIKYNRFSNNGKRLVGFHTKPIHLNGELSKFELSLASIDLDSIKVGSYFMRNNLPIDDFNSGKIDIKELILPFAVGGDLVYVSENSDSQYIIFCFDEKGKKVSEIQKTFDKIRLSEKEKAGYNRFSKTMFKKTRNFKKAINEIHLDKYGRLLVIPNVDRNIHKVGFFIDIFKNGKFLNRADYLFTSSLYIEYFLGNRLYIKNLKDNVIDVYDY